MVAPFDPDLGRIVADESDTRLSRYIGGPGHLRLAQGCLSSEVVSRAVV